MRTGLATLCLGAALAIGCGARDAPRPQGMAGDVPSLPGPADQKGLRDGSFLPRGFNRTLVTIECDDHYRLSGELLRRQRTSAKLPGVIFLHDLGQDRNAWYPLTLQVAARGFAVLAVDLRGHGESLQRERGWTGEERELTQQELQIMPQDVRNVVAHLAMIREVDGGQLAVVGMGLGADLGLIAGAQTWADSIRCMIAISPGVDRHGMPTLAAAREIPANKAVYLVAAMDDELSLNAAKRIMAMLEGSAELFRTEAKGEGVFRHGLLTKIPAWLIHRLGAPQKRPGAGAGSQP